MTETQTQQRQRTEAKWMTGYGVMCHYLADTASSKISTGISIADWNERVESFNVARFAQQIAAAGASYVIFTLGQNSGFFCSPNATYDGFVGKPSRLSERDLMGDLVAALKPAGVQLIAYLPSHAPANHRQAVERLRCTPKWDASRWQLTPDKYSASENVDERLSTFQQGWEAVIREWSTRWGDRLSGWWIDGCYHADRMYCHDDAPNFASFAAALKAGNPQSVIAFNLGVSDPIRSNTVYDDYTPGEVNSLALPHKFARWETSTAGAKLHILSYLGEWWGEGPLRIPGNLAAEYTRTINGLGGAVTWDIPVGHDGEIAHDFVRVLQSVRRGAYVDCVQE